MTEQDLAQIAAACDRVLRAPGTSVGRVAVPMLHVINEHPGWICQYAPLFPSAGSGAGRIAAPSARLTDSARAIIRSGRALMRSLRSQLEAQPWAGKDTDRVPVTASGSPGDGPAQPPVDVLIVSHLCSTAQLDSENDFYFGGLQKLLQERGLTSTRLFVNHLAGNSRSAAILASRSVHQRFLLSQTAPPWDEARIWGRCARARHELQQIATQAKIPLDRAIATLASRHALSWGTAANLRLHNAIAGFCSSLNPRIVITTYEGDACERIIWHAARSSDRRPLCVGYQHTRVLRLAHAIRRCVDAPGFHCDPDVILTLGEVSHEDLAASVGLRSVSLIPFGSHRHTGSPVQLREGGGTRSCLVLPDAHECECTLLFEFAVACALRNPDMTFTLRPHPLVDLSALLSRHHWLRSLPANATLSCGTTLEQECARASYCLYRGSSAVTAAVIAGVRPLYLKRSGELSFDPLFALPEWRLAVSSPAEFRARVLMAEGSREPESARRAASFCRRYVAPVREAAIDELLMMAARR